MDTNYFETIIDNDSLSFFVYHPESDRLALLDSFQLLKHDGHVYIPLTAFYLLDSLTASGWEQIKTTSIEITKGTD